MGQLRIAINGFGRIGRNVFKIAIERSDMQIVAINDVMSVDKMAYLLKHDSNYGMYHKDVSSHEGELIVGECHVKVYCESSPENLPWLDNDVDVVIESSGKFTKKEEVERHLRAGAKRVVVSCPMYDEGVDTIVLGVNEDIINDSAPIVSGGSPTTNSLGALMSILDEEFGVQKSMLTAIHSYTSSQSLVDASADNLRDGRSAAENIIPSLTGATTSLVKILPQFVGKFDGLSLRVPTPVVSISDLTVLLGKNTTAKEINDVLIRSSNEPFYKGILEVSDESLVGRDYIGNSHSCIVDLSLTKVVDGNLAKVMVWYDNEWGYSSRLVELAADIGRSLHN